MGFLIGVVVGVVVGFAVHEAPALAGVATEVSRLAGKIPGLGKFMRNPNLLP